MSKGTVLVTGGAGFVGSHTVVELVNNDYDVIVVDNMCNASADCIKRLRQMTGKEILCYEVDMLNPEALNEVFQKHKVDQVVHFAALKAVGESVEKPLLYYRNNIDSTLNLLEAMKRHGARRLVFSSSATVYGSPQQLPIAETHPVGQGVTNPYGKTKFFIEHILQDLVAAEPDFCVSILRYFNPIGAHKSGLIGENPRGVPNNLMPYLAQVAIGKRAELLVYGDDYDTVDGTGVRDYIHVVDLAEGHVCALDKLKQLSSGLKVYNLGTGSGCSVLQLHRAFEKACGKQIPFKVVGRRQGDLAVLYADTSTAEAELGWRAKRGIDEMCEDVWRWQSNNINGFVN